MPSLADLLKTSIQSQFPDLWQFARVTLVFKEGDKAEMSNYHPVSVLSVIARLFAKLVANPLRQHINELFFGPVRVFALSFYCDEFS